MCLQTPMQILVEIGIQQAIDRFLVELLQQFPNERVEVIVEGVGELRLPISFLCSIWAISRV